MSLGLSFGLIIFQCQTSLIDVAFVLIILDWHDDCSRLSLPLYIINMILRC